MENPLINGIEILRTDLAPTPAEASTFVRRSYRGGEVGSDVAVPMGGMNWNTVRGAFMLNGNLYTAWADGTFTRQTFNGTSYGPAIPVDTADQIVVLGDWHADVEQATGMF